jgi:cardiolipin synthase (CMP-forming)
MASPFVKERFDQVRLINIANAVTAGRLLLVPVFAYMLISGRFRGAIAVFAACGASDLLDGLIARWLRQRTVVGFYLDPIADKMLMATSFVMLAYVGVVPTWLTVLVISRDVFIIVGSSLILLLVGAQEVRPTILSKANTLMQLLTVLYFLLIHAFPEGASQILGAIRPAATGAVIVLCAATTALSGLQYLYIGMRKLSHA